MFIHGTDEASRKHTSTLKTVDRDSRDIAGGGVNTLTLTYSVRFVDVVSTDHKGIDKSTEFPPSVGTQRT